MYLNLVMPEDSRAIDFHVRGERRRPQLENESGFPVAWDQVELPAGDEATVELQYYIRRAWDPGQGTFDFTLYPQATVNPDAFTVQVRAPEGLSFSDGESDATSSGVLDRVHRLSFELRS
jgi:hypothetical protein